jgi:hypothetical protein
MHNNPNFYPNTAALGVTDTSYEAGSQIDHKTWEKLVLDRLRVIPSTMDEVADYYSVSVLTTRPRGSQLKARGEIFDTGLRRKNRFGRNCCVMDVVPSQSRLF